MLLLQKINNQIFFKLSPILRIAEQLIFFSLFYIYFSKNLTIPAYGYLLFILFCFLAIETYLILPIFNNKELTKNLFINYLLLICFLIFKAFQELIFSGGFLNLITYINHWLILPNGITVSFQLNQTFYSFLGIFLVSLASICILLFSIEYLLFFEVIKFLQFMIIFVVFMLINILASDLIFTFIGWEGIGLMSFILINFWKSRHEANKAALKAFLINKIGDFVFFLVIIILILASNSSEFFSLNLLFITSSSLELKYLSWLFLLVVLSKSAQFFLHFWLDDAMEGPTPVSALIHAATLVTAGSFLFVKIAILFSQPSFLNLTLLVGLFSSLIGILASLEQDDLKKTVAYTTLTNIGLVFIFFGLGFFHLALFHLIVHGFYKAFTFLALGNFIHLTGGEQSANFKGLTAKIFSLDFFFIMLSSFSMIGFPFLGAFYSKESLFNFSAYTSNLFFLCFISIIWFLGILSNFSLLSLFFKNLPTRNINIILSEFHKSKLFIDSILILLVFIILSIPLIIFNFFMNFNLTLLNTPLLGDLIQQNLLTNSFNLLNQIELYTNIIQILGFIIVPLLLSVKTSNSYLNINNSISDFIILGIISLFGKFIKTNIKIFYNIFMINEYIIIEKIYFYFIKNIFYSQVKYVKVVTKYSNLLLVTSLCSFLYLAVILFIFI